MTYDVFAGAALVLAIIGSLIGVYVRTETRANLHTARLNDLDRRVNESDLRAERLRESIDRLNLTIQRLVVLEESRRNAL